MDITITVQGWDRNDEYDALVATIVARRNDGERSWAIPVLVSESDLGRADKADVYVAILWDTAWAKLAKKLIEEEERTPTDCEALRPQMPPLPTGYKP